MINTQQKRLSVVPVAIVIAVKRLISVAGTNLMDSQFACEFLVTFRLRCRVLVWVVVDAVLIPRMTFGQDYIFGNPPRVPKEEKTICIMSVCVRVADL